MDDDVTAADEAHSGVEQKYAVVTFAVGGLCVLPLGDTPYDYVNRLDLQLQPLVGDITAVFEYNWKGFKGDPDRHGHGGLSTIYIDNMCGKVNLTGVVSSALLQVAKLVNPSYHFGIKYKFFTIHGQYMMQNNQKSLTFKGCKDVSFVTDFIAKLTGEHNVVSQQPKVDMVSVTCAFHRPLCIAMGSLFDMMLRTLFAHSVKMNPRSDEDTQQMHFKVTDWAPFLQHIKEGNHFMHDVPQVEHTPGDTTDTLFDVDALANSAVTSVGVNANGVFKVRFTWVAAFSCCNQEQINRFAYLANSLCLVLLSKIGVI
jgi:hypothetical protein